MIKNIVFDIGNVLADYRLKEFLAEKGFDGAMIKRIIMASVMSPYWEQFERSAITEEEALKAFVSLDPEIEQELTDAYSDVHGMLVIRDYAVEWIKELKAKGFNLYYLSNYSRKAYVDCSDSLAFMEYMDGGVLSFQVKMTKPDIDIYNLFLDKYNLNAEECIFIDDTKENVEVANSLGIRGILFDDYENVRMQLDKLIG